MVLVLALAANIYAVHLLFGPEVKSVCKMSPAASNVEVMAALMPMLVFTPMFFTFWSVLDAAFSWPILLLLQGNWATILSGWMAICAFGCDIYMVLRLCFIRAVFQIALWMFSHFEASNY
jgi:hypothetical protein